MSIYRTRTGPAMGRSNYGRRRGGRGGGFSMRLLPILLFGLYFAYYYFSNQEEVAMTGRNQLIDITQEQEMALGLQSWEQIRSESRVITHGRNIDLIRDIGERLKVAAREQDPGFDWEFNLIESDQANAFCLPGGKVAVYSGILEIAENTDGLAIVMGHEIAHAIARHGAERMAHQKLVQFGSMAAGMALGGMDIGAQRAVMGAMGAGSQYGILLPFSRKHESEADYIGLIYAARACYDPREAPKLWQRMNEASGARATSEFASTHPTPETRIQQFEEWMPEALEIYAKNCE